MDPPALEENMVGGAGRGRGQRCVVSIANRCREIGVTCVGTDGWLAGGGGGGGGGGDPRDTLDRGGGGAGLGGLGGPGGRPGGRHRGGRRRRHRDFCCLAHKHSRNQHYTQNTQTHKHTKRRTHR